jgi:hypothetical protein
MSMWRIRAGAAIAVIFVAAFSASASAQVLSPPSGNPEPERLRGQIMRIDGNTMTVQTADGKSVRLGLGDGPAVFTLSKASYADLDFGTYVGAVSEKLGDHIYSPIVRDSLSWLHKGLELRIIDESLRGIAVGHTRWDLTPTSVMTHGWVDDREERVISIKYGPTDDEECDVEIMRDTPVFRMARGDLKLVKQGMRVFVGAMKGSRGEYEAVFIFVGKDGVVPRL